MNDHLEDREKIIQQENDRVAEMFEQWNDLRDIGVVLI